MKISEEEQITPLANCLYATFLEEFVLHQPIDIGVACVVDPPVRLCGNAECIALGEWIVLSDVR